MRGDCYNGAMSTETSYVTYATPQEVPAELVRSYMNKVYNWMALSMAVTAGVAYGAINYAPMTIWCWEHPLLLMIATFVCILAMAFGRNRISASGLGMLFLVFSAAEGAVLGPVLSLYTTQSLATTFACTGGMFLAMSIYGRTTKRDLSGMGGTLMMMLFGLIIAGIVNIFWGNGMMDLICCTIGVVVFSLFTAYDTQMLLNQGFCTDEEMRRKGAILGAMSLYLDFLNLFLYLLRFLGDRE